MITTLSYNQSNQSLKWPGIAGAKVRQGTPSPYYDSGPGDSLLLDFSRGFFAVADSSAANSKTGYNFLTRLKKVVGTLPSYDPFRIHNPEELENIKDTILENASSLLHSVPKGESSTFTGILLCKGESGTKAILLHTGDSYLFQCHTSTNTFQQVTENNFLMVGRTRTFFQVEIIDVLPDSCLILASDGFCDLDFPSYTERNNFLLNIAKTHPIEEIPDKVIENISGRQSNVDDLGIITLSPDNLFPNSNKFLI